MNLIRFAIERTIAVVAAVLMVVMFGLVALQSIPIQLAPDVHKPVITITTNWPGAAPAEIEREIVNRQEEALKGLRGLSELGSSSQNGRGRITLEFDINQDMDRALLLVANRLDRVTGYPEEADEPALKTAEAEDRAIAWFMLQRGEGDRRPIHTFGDFADDIIRERLERVPGVGQANAYGGSEREMQVIVDPERMARYGLTVPAVVDALRRANASISAGDIDEGKRRWVVRTEGEFQSLHDVRGVVLRTEASAGSGRVARVTVGDIATVAFAYKKPTATIRQLGQPSIALNTIREAGANVIDVMAGIRQAVAELNDGPLPAEGVTLEQVYDETVYINSAIELVTQNIYIGGSLAALVLLLFLRSLRATLVVSLAIPVSVVGTFVAMAALGRSINVVSLAGIAFAVGMVVDAAIVVLENIYRLRQRGVPVAAAAYEGARQVWGAVLVSALTTVLVFLPILVMKLEVGQLFRDIAVAISVSVLLSLLVSVTVIPALANRLLGGRVGTRRLRLVPIDWPAELVVRLLTGFTRLVVGRKALAILVVGAVSSAAGYTTWQFLPKLEYLPEGNRNLVFGHVLPPPGYNLETVTGIATAVEDATRPHWASETGPVSAPGEPPKFSRFFFVARGSSTFLGAKTVEPERARELIPILRKAVFNEPGTFAMVRQSSVFGRGLGGSRSINLDISGGDLEEILAVAVQAVELIQAALPREEGNQLRPRPGLELGAPEVRVEPDRVRLADAGISARELGLTLDAFNDGLRVAEITVDGKRIDLTLRGPDAGIFQTQGIDNLPVVTRSGKILPVSSLARVINTSGPTEIRHRERVRTVTLQVTASPKLALEEALDILRAEVIDLLRADGLPPGVRLSVSGTADKLSRTWDAMRLDLLMAMIIVYLVMVILFESFFYPLIIMLSVPLAAAGGVLGLTVLNQFYFQPLDMLTLLGFVILVGIVVNNAILLVHQSLYHHRRDGMPVIEAILEATRNRIRPIFMSTLTSVVGMLPLVLFQGAGQELYRGLGSVVIGGLALSALLTLAIIPPLLVVFMGVLESRRSRRASQPVAEPQAAE